MTAVSAASTLLPPLPDLSDARRRLFEVAIVLFGERGYHAVTVREMANELGQQPGALYAHVRSKQDLLYQLVTIGIEEHRDRVKAALLDAGREPTAQLRAIVREHVRVHLEFQSLARVTNRELRSLHDEQLAAVLLQRSETERMFIDVVERGIRLGEFTVKQPTLAMHAIGSMGIQAAEWWLPSDAHSIDLVADTYADFAVHMLS